MCGVTLYGVTRMGYQNNGNNWIAAYNNMYINFHFDYSVSWHIMEAKGTKIEIDVKEAHRRNYTLTAKFAKPENNSGHGVWDNYKMQDFKVS